MEAHFKSKLKEVGLTLPHRPLLYTLSLASQADFVKHKSEVIQKLTASEFGQIWKGFSDSE